MQSTIPAGTTARTQEATYFLPMPTTYLIREVLGRGMYRDMGRCLAELYRNGLVAGMDSVWDPSSVRIDISIVPNHPLASRGDSALIVLDYGRGMTDADLERYFKYLGPSPKASRKDGGFSGASQKGIGRFAALALSEQSDHDDCPYYVLSRTQEDGPVRYIKVTPDLLCRAPGIEVNRFISPSATEMGPLKNSINGSFTAVIIPTPALKTHAEVEDAIKWYLPREPDKMCRLTVGGKPMLPPPLPSGAGAVTAMSQDQYYRAYIGPSNGNGGSEGGVWFCDGETGFRVASCQDWHLRGKGLPDVFWYPELAGDIFVPGLLDKQDTARSSLEKDFTKTREWKKLCQFLSINVEPRLTDLIEQNPIEGDAAEAVEGVISLFEEAWGLPPEITSTREKKSGTTKTKTKTGGGVGGGGGGGNRGPRKPRYQRINVRGEVFELFLGRSLDEFVFAEVNHQNPRQIELNVRGSYQAFPKGKQAQLEHSLMQVLMAIARSDAFPMDNGAARDNFNPGLVAQFANELRAEALSKKKT